MRLLSSHLWRELQSQSDVVIFALEVMWPDTDILQESDAVSLEEDDPIGVDAMLRYLQARVIPNLEIHTLGDISIQLITADKHCLQTLALSTKMVIGE